MRHSLIFCTYKTYTPDYLGYTLINMDIIRCSKCINVVLYSCPQQSFFFPIQFGESDFCYRVIEGCFIDGGVCFGCLDIRMAKNPFDGGQRCIIVQQQGSCCMSPGVE